jgi:hypothetical protein
VVSLSRPTSSVCDVCSWPKADIALRISDVRFNPVFSVLQLAARLTPLLPPTPEDTRSGPSRQRGATHRQRAHSQERPNSSCIQLISAFLRIAASLARESISNHWFCGDLPPVGCIVGIELTTISFAAICRQSCCIVGYFGGRNGFGGQPVAHAQPWADARQRTTERSGNQVHCHAVRQPKTVLGDLFAAVIHRRFLRTHKFDWLRGPGRRRF